MHRVRAGSFHLDNGHPRAMLEGSSEICMDPTNLPQSPTQPLFSAQSVATAAQSQNPSAVVAMQLLTLAEAVDRAHPNTPNREAILERATEMFQKLVRADHVVLLARTDFRRSVAEEPLVRFSVGSALCDLFSEDFIAEQLRKPINQLEARCRSQLAKVIEVLEQEIAATEPSLRAIRVESFLDRACVSNPSLRNLTITNVLRDPDGLSAGLRDEIVREQVLYYVRRAHELRSCVTASIVADLFETSLRPTPTALREVQRLCAKGGELFLALVVAEGENARAPAIRLRTTEDSWGMGQLVQLANAVLWYVISRNMPAEVATSVSVAIASLGRQGPLEKTVDMLSHFVKKSRCCSSIDDDRLPEPIGRGSFLGAVKGNLGVVPIGGALEDFPAVVPDSQYVWRYFGQRMEYLSKIKDPCVRQSRILHYVTSFREGVAAQDFYRAEETFFRQLHLKGTSSEEMQDFYSNVYVIDGALGAEETAEAQRPLLETAAAFRIMAAGRYGLNLRALYARSFGGNPWLFEDMAGQLQGDSQRFRVADRESYPGPGVRLHSLRLKNVVDLSTPESRRKYLEDAPWLATALKVERDVEYYFFRGFQIITRSLQASSQPISKYWHRHGSFNHHPYAAIIFNDHFHNDRLPEVRMWLVPEEVIHRKLALAIEEKIDVNRLDCTPEGLAEDAAAHGLPIFDVGSSDVRWGSFANAWPFGQGPVYSWEQRSSWNRSRWQSPRHIHRALGREDYREELTPEVKKWIMQARGEHAHINKRVRFFLDLHSAFLTMEEAWAKDYVNAEEGPARLDRPTPSSEGQKPLRASDSDADGAEPDMSVQRSNTRLLEHFLAIRNEIARTNPHATFEDFPILELQYTRLFVQQPDTYILSGADMALYDPQGSRWSVYHGGDSPIGIIRGKVHLDEPLEAAWVRCFQSHFAPGNIPRIRMP
jgi:hypothetical protein